MSHKPRTEPVSRQLTYFTLLLAVTWTLIFAISLVWHFNTHKQEIINLARYVAKTHFDKDVLYRRWNAMQGGVFAEVSPVTPPNPYLDGLVPLRDIPLPDNRMLTLINPAYMTRQVHELSARTYNIRGHITSLNPIRPANRALPWEKKGLQALAGGAEEYWGIITDEKGKKQLRFIKPLFTEASCLQCHASQGYKEGDIRGGISVTVPLAPFLAATRRHSTSIILKHFTMWLLGLFALLAGYRRQRKGQLERARYTATLEEREHRLRQALDEIKTLQGIIPICSKCKKIRDDKGYWHQVESYVESHSRAQFSHGLCEQCADELYGGQDWYKKKTKDKSGEI